jgi:hypothetical protein
MRLRTITAILCLIIGASFALPKQAHAAPAGWNAGNIISDSVFTSSTSMSSSQIQEFLNSKVVTCDTYGEQLSEFGGPDLNGDGKVQRWEWGKANYNQTTFPCLKDVRVADGRSAAQVIYDTSVKYGISPKVLIVLLQKEQGLVTDTWPLSIQYRSATGYGCPDTAPCNADYYWLDNQLDWSAKMFRAIMNATPTWYTPYLVGNNYVQYNPDDSCGGSTVYIANRATQALYNYTPYQPNDAALNAPMGATVSCGAYGNLNFYRYYTQWFGPTQGGDAVSYDLQLVSPITLSPANPRPGEAVTATYSIKNIGSNTVTWDMDVLQCRNATVNCDPAPGATRSIAPGETVVRSFPITPLLQGDLVLVPFYRVGGNWWRLALNTDKSNSLTTWVAGLSTTSGLVSSSSTPNIGETMKYTITISNPRSTPLTIDGTLLQCRYEISTMCDSPMTSSETIPAWGSKTYTYNIPASQSGNYTLTAYYRYKGVWFRYVGGDTPKQMYVSNIVLDTPPAINPINPIPGESFTVTYTIRNAGSTTVNLSRSVTQCRVNASINCDPAARPSVSLNQNQTTTISDTFVAILGSYKLVPYYDVQGEWHTFPATAPTIFTVEGYVADLRITNPILTNNPIPGEPLTATYSVKNFGSKTAYYQMGLLQCRYNTAIMCDSSNYGAIAIEPGATRSFNDTPVSRVKSGNYTLRPLYRQDGKWYEYKISDGSRSYDGIVETVEAHTPNLKVIDFHTNLPSPLLGQVGTVEYTVRNDDSRTINGDMSVTQCRINTFINCDPAAGAAYSLSPGTTKTFTDTFTYGRVGEYRFIPYLLYDGQWLRPLDLSGHLSLMRLTVK